MQEKFQRLLGVVIAPRETFQKIKEKPDILFPFFIVAFGILIPVLIGYPVFKSFLIKNLNDTLQPKGIEVTDFLIKVSLIAAYIGIPINSVFSWLLKGIVIHPLTKIFNAEGTFKEKYRILLSAVGYSSFVIVLGQLLITIVAYIIGSYDVKTSLALFLPGSLNNTSFIFRFFSHLDFFVIWYQLLVSVAVSVIYDMKFKKSALIVIGTWLIFVLISSIAVVQG